MFVIIIINIIYMVKEREFNIFISFNIFKYKNQLNIKFIKIC